MYRPFYHSRPSWPLWPSTLSGRPSGSNRRCLAFAATSPGHGKKAVIFLLAGTTTSVLDTSKISMKALVISNPKSDLIWLKLLSALFSGNSVSGAPNKRKWKDTELLTKLNWKLLRSKNLFHGTVSLNALQSPFELKEFLEKEITVFWAKLMAISRVCELLANVKSRKSSITVIQDSVAMASTCINSKTTFLIVKGISSSSLQNNVYVKWSVLGRKATKG